MSRRLALRPLLLALVIASPGAPPGLRPATCEERAVLAYLERTYGLHPHRLPCQPSPPLLPAWVVDEGPPPGPPRPLGLPPDH